MKVITRLLRSDEPVSFAGAYYRLDGAVLMPRPTRRGGPPILVGGNGPARTLPLVARYADEWNALHLTLYEFAVLNARLDDQLRAVERAPRSVFRSPTLSLVYGRDREELDARVAARPTTDPPAGGAIVGTAPEVVEQITRLGAVGVDRVIVRWSNLDDDAGLEAFGRAVVPLLAA